MKVWQAHLALAQMMGDPIAVSGSPVVSLADGVRYSKNLRDLYLYRAMMSILEGALQPLSAQPVQIGDILSRYMPNFIVQEQVNDLTSLVGDVSNADLRWNLSRRPIAVISVFNDSGVQFRQETLSRFHNNVAHPYHAGQQDPTFAIYTPQAVAGTNSYGNGTVILRATGNYQNKWGGSPHFITYVPTPTNPADQTPEQVLDFEPILYDKVLNTANTFAKIDSQEGQ